MKFLKKDKVLFDGISSIYNPIIKTFRKSKKHAQKIRDLGLQKGDHVLEVGGGTGLVAQELCKEADITILDPSSKMLEKVKLSEITKKIGIAQDIPFENNMFDVVYCVDAFHHFTNGKPKKEWDEVANSCITEMLRVLKKEGTLIIIEFDTTQFGGKFWNFVENKVMKWGSYFLSAKELKKLFEGFDVMIEISQVDASCYAAKITLQQL